MTKKHCWVLIIPGPFLPLLFTIIRKLLSNLKVILPTPNLNRPMDAFFSEHHANASLF